MTIGCAKVALCISVWAGVVLGALGAGRYHCRCRVAQLKVSGLPSSMDTWMAIVLAMDSCPPLVHALQAHKHAVEAASLPVLPYQCCLSNAE